jgi:hypothetical protein
MKLRTAPWTDEQTERLKAYVAAGKSAFRAAAAFKRSIAGVRNQARKLGMPFPSVRAERKRLEDPSQPQGK